MMFFKKSILVQVLFIKLDIWELFIELDDDCFVKEVKICFKENIKLKQNNALKNELSLKLILSYWKFQTKTLRMQTSRKLKVKCEKRKEKGLFNKP